MTCVSRPLLLMRINGDAMIKHHAAAVRIWLILLSPEPERATWCLQTKLVWILWLEANWSQKRRWWRNTTGTKQFSNRMDQILWSHHQATGPIPSYAWKEVMILGKSTATRLSRSSHQKKHLPVIKHQLLALFQALDRTRRVPGEAYRRNLPQKSSSKAPQNQRSDDSEYYSSSSYSRTGSSGSRPSEKKSAPSTRLSKKTQKEAEEKKKQPTVKVLKPAPPQPASSKRSKLVASKSKPAPKLLRKIQQRQTTSSSGSYSSSSKKKRKKWMLIMQMPTTCHFGSSDSWTAFRTDLMSWMTWWRSLLASESTKECSKDASKGLSRLILTEPFRQYGLSRIQFSNRNHTYFANFVPCLTELVMRLSRDVFKILSYGSWLC